MSHGPNVSMGGGSFDFDKENRPGSGAGPGGPGPNGPGSNGPGSSGGFGPGGPGSNGPGGSGGFGPGGPGSSGGFGSGASGSGRRKRKFGCGTLVGIVVLLVVLAFVFQSCSNRSSAAANCGDYDLVDGKYVSAPDRGDYERAGDGYEYVGCNTSRSGGGGFFFFPFFFGGGSSGSGSNYGDGSGFRGGGPGSGK